MIKELSWIELDLNRHYEEIHYTNTLSWVTCHYHSAQKSVEMFFLLCVSSQVGTRPLKEVHTNCHIESTNILQH